MVKLLMALDLANSQPAFVWRSRLAYDLGNNGSNKTVVFGRLSKAGRLSFVLLFVFLVLTGAMEIAFGLPWYVPVVPLVVTGIGTWASSVHRKSFAGCRIEIEPDGVAIISHADRWKIPPLAEVCVKNRWKRREGLSNADGSSELFLVVEETPGVRLFFPLADSGLLRDQDRLAADIASLAGCKLTKELIE